METLAPAIDPGDDPKADASKAEEACADLAGAEQRPNLLGPTYEDIRRFQAGDGEALNRLFARYYDRVLSWIRIRMGDELRGVIEPSDFAQRTFEVAMKRLQDFEMREPAALMHWLCRLAENQIRDELKRIRSQKHDVRRERPLGMPRADSGTSWIGAALAGSSTAPPERLAKEEMVQIVEAAISRLPEDHKQVILLRVILDSSLSYSAEALQRTPEAAAMLYARAKVNLMKLLERHLEQE